MTSIKQVFNLVQTWKQQGQVVVLATGVFDLLHIEHLRFLQKAKAAGDKLIVGLERDARVKEIKGPYRPLNPQHLRLEQVTSLKAVDAAFLLPAKFNTQASWEKLIQDLGPDIYAVSQHSPHLSNKRAILNTYGGQVKIVHPYNPQLSTSLLIARLINPHLGKSGSTFTTPIVSGHGRGKTFGYPTLNLIIPSDFPYQHGIYAGWVWLDNKCYQGAFHYGPIPVFGQNQPSLEVYLITPSPPPFTPKQLKFQLVSYLRPIKAFTSTTDLARQIGEDVRLTTTLLSTTPRKAPV